MAKKDKEKKSKKDKTEEAPAKASKRLILQDVRGVWVYLQTPRPAQSDDEDDNPTYEIEALLDPKANKKAIAGINAMAEACAKEAGFKKNWRHPLRDGDEWNEEQDDKEKRNKYYKGMKFLKLKTWYRPGVVNRQGEPAMPEDFSEMGFSGCYFNISVTAKAYDYNGNKGVRIQLGNVMLRKVGKRLDNNVSAEDEFAKYAD